MKKMYRVLGKRGRITIPDEIRQSTGFCCDDILSFTQQDEDTVIIRREKICDHCRDREDDRDTEKNLLDFLNSLSEGQQRTAIVHLSENIGKNLAAKKGGAGNG